MKVVEVGTGRRPIPPPGYGAIERAIAELMPALRSAGACAELVNEIEPGRHTAGWTFERALPRLLRDADADVIHVHTSRAAWVLGYRRTRRERGPPVVYTTHTPSWVRPLRRHQSVMFEVERQAIRWSAASIATTPAVAGAVEAVRGRRGPVVTIPLGVDAEKFKAKGTGDRSRVLGVGVIERRKRWHVAAEAVRGLPVRLTIVGPVNDIAYAHEVRALGAELVGEVPEPELLRRFEEAYVLLHPAAWETTGFVFSAAQAMSFSRPVIGGPAIAGLTPFAAPSNGDETVTAFVHATLSRLLSDDREYAEAAAEARRIVTERHAWPAIAREYVRLFEAVGRR